MLVLHAGSLDSPPMVKLNSSLLQLEDHILFLQFFLLKLPRQETFFHIR